MQLSFGCRSILLFYSQTSFSRLTPSCICSVLRAPNPSRTVADSVCVLRSCLCIDVSARHPGMVHDLRTVLPRAHRLYLVQTFCAGWFKHVSVLYLCRSVCRRIFLGDFFVFYARSQTRPCRLSNPQNPFFQQREIDCGTCSANQP